MTSELPLDSLPRLGGGDDSGAPLPSQLLLLLVLPSAGDGDRDGVLVLGAPFPLALPGHSPDPGVGEGGHPRPPYRLVCRVGGGGGLPQSGVAGAAGVQGPPHLCGSGAPPCLVQCLRAPG